MYLREGEVGKFFIEAVAYGHYLLELSFGCGDDPDRNFVTFRAWNFGIGEVVLKFFGAAHARGLKSVAGSPWTCLKGGRGS